MDTSKKPLIALISILFYISAGGLLIHIRIHPPGEKVFNWIPLVFGLITVFAVPVLFYFRATMPWAYVLNLVSVILGAATMGYFSATHWQGEVTLWRVISETTLADILILLAKLPTAHLILQYYRRQSQESKG